MTARLAQIKNIDTVSPLRKGSRAGIYSAIRANINYIPSPKISPLTSYNSIKRLASVGRTARPGTSAHASSTPVCLRNKLGRIINALRASEPDDYPADLLSARRQVFIDSIRIGSLTK